MDLDRFERISELFEGARPLAAEARTEFLDRQCGGDQQLQHEVLALLRHHDESSGPLNESVVKGWSGINEISPIHSVQPDTLPERIGRYRILALVGEGGFGVVYRAQQDQPRRDVALKVLRSTLYTPRIIKRFEIEGEVLGRLQHPGIASIYESGTDLVAGQRVAYLAMEFVNGLSLTRIAAERHLQPRERIGLFIKVCEAVHYAHQRGVIHRDLKPDNILVEDKRVASGPPGDVDVGGSEAVRSLQPKVLDFGVARVTDVDVQVTTMHTGLGQLVGTLAYMSPEQLSGDTRQIDVRSDVYSLGVVLFEMLTGRLPCDVSGTSIPEAVEKLRHADPARLSRSSPHLRGDLQTIVLKALARDPVRRYQSAGELADDLRRYLAGDAIAARRDSGWYVFRKTVRRHRVAVSVASLFVLLISVSAVVLAILLQKQTLLLTQVTEAKQQADKRFGEVRELAHTFIFDFHDRIAGLPGSTESREFVVATALEYLEKLSEDAGTDDELLAELAEAYVRVGSVQGYPNNPNLGDIKGALESYDRGLSIFNQLGGRNSSVWDVRHKTASAMLARAEILLLQGRMEEALGDFESCREQFSELLRQRPDDLDLNRELGSSILLMGGCLGRMGNIEQSLVEQKQALEILQTTARRSDAGGRERQSLSLALLYMGDRMTDMGDAAAALQYYEQSLQLRDQLVQDEPRNAIYRRGLAVIWTRIGNVQGNPLQRRPHLGNVDAAAESYARGMTIFKELLDADPSDARAVRDLCIAYEKLGDIEAVRKRFAESLDHYARMLELNYAYLKLDADNPTAKADLVTSEARVGVGHALLNQRQSAFEFLDRALTTAQTLKKEHPENPEHEYHVAWVSGRYAFTFETLAGAEDANRNQALDDWRSALAWYEKAEAIYAKIRDEGKALANDADVLTGYQESLVHCRAVIAELEAK